MNDAGERPFIGIEQIQPFRKGPDPETVLRVLIQGTYIIAADAGRIALVMLIPDKGRIFLIEQVQSAAPCAYPYPPGMIFQYRHDMIIPQADRVLFIMYKTNEVHRAVFADPAQGQPRPGAHPQASLTVEKYTPHKVPR